MEGSDRWEENDTKHSLGDIKTVLYSVMEKNREKKWLTTRVPNDLCLQNVFLYDSSTCMAK